MARGRMISQTVATDKRLNSLSEEAELAFLKTIPHLDRDGLIVGDPVLLAAKICPRRPALGAQLGGIIREWIDSGLIISYDTDEDPVLFFPGFTKNQVGLRYDREPASVYPPPPGYYRNGNGLEPTENEPAKSGDGNVPPTSGKHPANIRQTSGTIPPEVKEKVKEINTTTARETIRSEDNEAAGASGGGSVPMANEGWGEVVTLYESNIGTFTALTSEMVHLAVDEYGVLLVKDAIRESVRQNVRKWAYVDGILKRWHANGRDSPKAKDAPRKPQTITIYNQYTGKHEERVIQ
jgi:DnaD/phage-associated family protein